MTTKKKTITHEPVTQLIKIMRVGIVFLAITGLGVPASADVSSTVTCKDGTKVEVGGTDHLGTIACISHGGNSTFHKRKVSPKRVLKQVPKLELPTHKKHLSTANKTKMKPQFKKLTPVDVKRNSINSLRARGYNISGKTVSFRSLPIKVQTAIEGSFNQQMRGRSQTQACSSVKPIISSFASETQGGSKLNCQVAPTIIGCWHGGASSFTGCVKENGEWECLWNEDTGGNEC